MSLEVFLVANAGRWMLSDEKMQTSIQRAANSLTHMLAITTDMVLFPLFSKQMPMAITMNPATLQTISDVIFFTAKRTL